MCQTLNTSCPFFFWPASVCSNYYFDLTSVSFPIPFFPRVLLLEIGAKRNLARPPGGRLQHWLWPKAGHCIQMEASNFFPPLMVPYQADVRWSVCSNYGVKNVGRWLIGRCRLVWAEPVSLLQHFLVHMHMHMHTPHVTQGS